MREQAPGWVGVPAMMGIGTVRAVVVEAYPQDGTRAEREANTSALEALDRIERVVAAAKEHVAANPWVHSLEALRVALRAAEAPTVSSGTFTYDQHLELSHEFFITSDPWRANEIVDEIRIALGRTMTPTGSSTMDAYQRLVSALEAIRGPEDGGPFINAYRAAGGGYEGLQAIAREALT